MGRPPDLDGSRSSRPDRPGWRARRVARRRDTTRGTSAPRACPAVHGAVPVATFAAPAWSGRTRRGRAGLSNPFTRTHAARGPTRPAARRSGTCAGPFSRLVPAAQTAHGLQTCALHYRLRLTPSRPPPPILPPPPATAERAPYVMARSEATRQSVIASEARQSVRFLSFLRRACPRPDRGQESRSLPPQRPQRTPSFRAINRAFSLTDPAFAGDIDSGMQLDCRLLREE